MKTTTLFEKYRPTTFDEVLGQDKAINKVKLLLERGWGGRAWWLSGASGTGKTTIAKIIASQGADDFYVTEYDSADAMSVSEFDRLEQDMWYADAGRMQARRQSNLCPVRLGLNGPFLVSPAAGRSLR